jgi:hypothetical protein
MADQTNIVPPGLTPEAIAFASRMFDAARAGQMDIFHQALPAGLPANMTNDKGDTLVCILSFILSPHMSFRNHVSKQYQGNPLHSFL